MLAFLSPVLSFLGRYWWQFGLAVIISGLFLWAKFETHQVVKEKAVITALKSNIVTYKKDLADARSAIDLQNVAIEKMKKDSDAAQQKVSELHGTLDDMDKQFNTKLAAFRAKHAPTTCEDTAVYLNNMALELRWSKK